MAWERGIQNTPVHSGLLLSIQRELVKSLEEEQQNMHTPTPVWEMRTSPPSDWNK